MEDGSLLLDAASWILEKDHRATYLVLLSDDVLPPAYLWASVEGTGYKGGRTRKGGSSSKHPLSLIYKQVRISSGIPVCLVSFVIAPKKVGGASLRQSPQDCVQLARLRIK